MDLFSRSLPRRKHTSLIKCCLASLALLLLLSPLNCGATGLMGFGCARTRSTGSSHDRRTLHIPAAMWDRAVSAEDLMWAEKLCCVYTWTAREESESQVYLSLYDGGTRQYPLAASFSAAAQSAYLAICGMSMGSDDCSTEAQRCPITYDPVGMLCRPRASDGYSVSTQVVNAAACRAKCNADSRRCGAFEYEYVTGDDRECGSTISLL